MEPGRWIMTGAILGALGVAIGAFGAHGLEAQLRVAGYGDSEVARRIEIFETAVRYQMYHAPLLVLLGFIGLRDRRDALNAAAWLFFAGIMIFSGLLYVLVFASKQWNHLGAIVPIGGVALILGWVTLAVAGWKLSRKNQPPADA